MARLGSLHSARPALRMADSPSGRNISGKEGGQLRGAALPAFRRLSSARPASPIPALQPARSASGGSTAHAGLTGAGAHGGLLASSAAIPLVSTACLQGALKATGNSARPLGKVQRD